jgi:hypothetical protein
MRKRRTNKLAVAILLIQILGPFGAIGIAYFLAPFIK